MENEVSYLRGIRGELTREVKEIEIRIKSLISPVYIVKCDDCKKTITVNGTFEESVKGGVCKSCQ